MECGDEFAKPFKMLVMLILYQCVWPETWIMHWIFSFLKAAQFCSLEII